MISRAPFRVNRMRLRPGSREAVRRWAAEMKERHAEVVETLRAEGVDLEMWLYEESDEGDSLYIVIQTADYDRAVEIFLASTKPADLVHRAFLESVRLDSRQLELLNCFYRDDPVPEAGA
ncbi:MAG TPA: DUF6176 family protein [Rubrivivax sp.]|nr:DUF6176 family protein [Rubrivivax sp.]